MPNGPATHTRARARTHTVSDRETERQRDKETETERQRKRDKNSVRKTEKGTGDQAFLEKGLVLEVSDQLGVLQADRLVCA